MNEIRHNYLTGEINHEVFINSLDTFFKGNYANISSIIKSLITFDYPLSDSAKYCMALNIIIRDARIEKESCF